MLNASLNTTFPSFHFNMYVHVYVSICMYVFRCMYMYVYIHVCMYVYVWMDGWIDMCMNVCVRVWIQTHRHTHTHTHTYIHAEKCLFRNTVIEYNLPATLTDLMALEFSMAISIESSHALHCHFLHFMTATNST